MNNVTLAKALAAVSFGILLSAPASLALGQTTGVKAPETAAAAPPAKSQSEMANPKATLGSIEAKNAKVTDALDPHNLTGAKALVGKTGSICGMISGVYAPASNKLVILNFDHDFRTAVSAVIDSANFSKFPDVQTLVGKKVLVTGKFTAYHTTAELIVAQAADIKVVK